MLTTLSLTPDTWCHLTSSPGPGAHNGFNKKKNPKQTNYRATFELNDLFGLFIYLLFFLVYFLLIWPNSWAVCCLQTHSSTSCACEPKKKTKTKNKPFWWGKNMQITGHSEQEVVMVSVRGRCVSACVFHNLHITPSKPIWLLTQWDWLTPSLLSVFVQICWRNSLHHPVFIFTLITGLWERKIKKERERD